MDLYGLIGKTLKHSFSKSYFENKFKIKGIHNSEYQLFELDELNQLINIKSNPNLKGFNVTIPYKKSIIPWLDSISNDANKIGAVNTVKVETGKTIGYNTDVYGFRESLKSFLPSTINSALILGNGGASKAVQHVLKQLNIDFLIVGRNGDFNIAFHELRAKHLVKNNLIINTTSLGMYPNIYTSPPIPYQHLSNQHYLYDLVYNPEESNFLKQGKKQGCKTKNGLEMLYLQAEKSWEIWNT